MVQTYEADDVAIRAAATYNRGMFLRAELPKRKLLGYPPYVRMANVLLWGADEHAVATEAELLHAQLAELVRNEVGERWQVLPAVPCVLAKLRGAYRWHIVVKCPLEGDLSGVLAPLFKMLEATFDLFVPLVMADIVNVGIAAHDFHYILVRCGILLLLAIIGLTCSLTAQYFSAKAAVGYSTGLRHALFEHIQTLSFSEMDTMGTSTLITRMTSDVNQVQSGLNLFLRLFLRSPFVVIGAMIMAFTVNFRAALIFVVAIPLLSIVVFGVMVITRPPG